MSEGEEHVRELREAIREFTEFLKQVVADPEIILRFEPVQVAWFMEHLEMMAAESKELAADIQEMLDKRK